MWGYLMSPIQPAARGGASCIVTSLRQKVDTDVNGQKQAARQPAINWKNAARASRSRKIDKHCVIIIIIII